MTTTNAGNNTSKNFYADGYRELLDNAMKDYPFSWLADKQKMCSLSKEKLDFLSGHFNAKFTAEKNNLDRMASEDGLVVTATENSSLEENGIIDLARNTAIIGNGTTGATTMIESMLLRLFLLHSPLSLQVVIIDPLEELQKIAKFPNVRSYFGMNKGKEFLTVFDLLDDFVDKCAEAFGVNEGAFMENADLVDVLPSKNIHTLIVINGLAELEAMVKDVKGVNAARRMQDQLAKIAGIGNRMNISVLLSSLRADEKTFPYSLQNFFSNRIMFRSNVNDLAGFMNFEVGLVDEEYLIKQGKTDYRQPDKDEFLPFAQANWEDFNKILEFLRWDSFLRYYVRGGWPKWAVSVHEGMLHSIKSDKPFHYEIVLDNEENNYIRDLEIVTKGGSKFFGDAAGTNKLNEKWLISLSEVKNKINELLFN